VSAEQAARRLQEQFGEAVLEVIHDRGEVTVVVAREALRAICRFLRDEPDLRFDFLSDICGVDYLTLGRRPRFAVVYHLYSLTHHHLLRLRVPVEESDPVVPSVADIWPGANFPERETYDMFGIRFEGHPNLTRILMPEDWVGYPLRKDFPLMEEEILFTHNLPAARRKEKP
jgi:NADH-quinone oxidoreductase subunit C